MDYVQNCGVFDFVFIRLSKYLIIHAIHVKITCIYLIDIFDLYTEFFYHMKFIFFIAAVILIGTVALNGAKERNEKRKEFWQVLKDEVEKDDSKKYQDNDQNNDRNQE